MTLDKSIDNLGVTASAQSPRARFIREVVAAFERANVEFVLLHGHDPEAPDSDLDIVVTRRSLGAVDALVRAGTFGRMLQRFQYGVPWYYTYVVERREAKLRYRELDVGCDPWGIGRYGPALPIALDFVKRNPDARALDAGAETAYLAIKRSQKGIRDERDRARLTAAAHDHWQAAGALLDPPLGSRAGLAVRSLGARGQDPEQALTSLAADIRRYRRTPTRLFLRASFQVVRALRRVWQPTGLVVLLVGPDGVGKSTLASALAHSAPGKFRRVDRRHLGPGLLPPPAKVLGRRPSDGTAPHAKPASGMIGATARLAYLWADALLGWLPRMAVPRARSSLVILERGWFDLAVDPRRYRLSPRPRAVSALGHFLPRPDLVLLLDAGADLVKARKDELEVGEVERQLRAWRVLLPRAGRHVHRLDATGSPEELLEQARELIHRELESRHPDVASATLPLGIAGSIARGGHRMGLVEVGDRPRWLIPSRFGGRGPLRARLYRPARAKQVPVALALEALASVGRLGTKLPIDLERGLLPALRVALGRQDLRLGAVALSRDRVQRVLVTLFAGRQLVGFAKVSAVPEPLHREQRVLNALVQAKPKAFVVPRPWTLLHWEGLTVLVLEPIIPRGRAMRPFGVRERAVLEELAQLGSVLEPILGSTPGLVPVHGDFAPWNTAPTRGGGYVVWDWEDARLGLPLEDLFHWRTQLLLLFGAGSVDELVTGANSPDPELAELCGHLELDSDAPPRALRAYLEWRASASTIDPRTDDIVRHALALLDGESS
ncbi:MAG: hypothetical protein WBM00_09120 [Solirubrobacterales bacterium]